MNKNKKILACTTSYLPFIGGAEIAIQEVSKRLAGRFDVIIITARQKRELPLREKTPVGTVIRVGFGTRFDKWIFPFMGVIAVVKLARAGEIPAPWKRSSHNLLLVWGMDISQGSLLGYVIKLFFPRIPFVCTVQYGYGNIRLHSGRGGLISVALKRLLRVADSITTISSYLMDTVHEYGFVGVEKIIPNGVDTSLFAFRSEYISEEHTQRNQRVIITTSRLVKKNAIDTLIYAVCEVKKKIGSIKCYVIGDGPERNTLERLVHDLQLSHNVIFLGSIPYEEIPFYLAQGDVFVRASRSEGMGNSFIEALSVGVPIIGTSVEGICDIIDDKKTGLFCRVDDPVDVAEKIFMVFNNDELVESMRKAGRQLVEEKFSWDSIARSYGDLFQAMLSVRSRVLIATPLYPPEIGGPATYTKTLTDGLLDVCVLARVARFSDVRHLSKVLRHICFAWRLWKQARYIDTIYAQDPVSVGFPAALVAGIRRKKFALKIVGDYAWEQGMQRFGVTELLDEFLQRQYGYFVALLRRIQYYTAQRAGIIIVPSVYLKKVVKAWGISDKKIMVVSNSFEIPKKNIAFDTARHHLGLHGYVIVSAGRMVAWKGFAALIHAAAKLVSMGIPVSLIIIGSGPLEQELTYMIATLGVGSYVRMIGRVGHDEMLMYLVAADVFVLNTGYEGFSHALLEAMAMKTLILTTQVGGNPELIKDGVNGFLVEYNNKRQLVDSLIAIHAMSVEECNRMKECAYETARRFNTQRMLGETAQLLISLCS